MQKTVIAERFGEGDDQNVEYIRVPESELPIAVAEAIDPCELGRGACVYAG